MASYLESITRELVRVLDHAAELYPARVAGYAVNLEFWVSECAHRLRVIDTYQQRFDRMRRAVATYEDEPIDWKRLDLDFTNPELAASIPERSRITTRSVKSSEKKVLRLELLQSAERFLRKCQKLSLVSPDALKAHCATLGIDPKVFGLGA